MKQIKVLNKWENGVQGAQTLLVLWKKAGENKRELNLNRLYFVLITDGAENVNQKIREEKLAAESHCP